MADGTATQNPIDTAPIFAPDGSVRQIPYQQLRDALDNGGKLAVQMKAPNGDVHYVPHDQIGAAAQAGGKVNSEQGTIAEPKPAEGFWHSLGSVLGLTPEAAQESQQRYQAAGGDFKAAMKMSLDAASPHPIAMAKSAASATGNEFSKGIEEGKLSADALKQGDIKGFLAHQIGQLGHAGATLAAPVMGENLSKAGEQLGEGNIKGGLGTVTGLIAPVVAGELVSGKKSVPRSTLSRTLKPSDPVEFHAAEQSAIPKINAAAQDLGQPIKTADDAIAAIRQAKQNALLDAHEAAGPGKTIADLPPDQLKALQSDMGALDTLHQHIKAAQEAAAETKPQPTRTEAAGQILKGGAKVAAGVAVDAVAPGLGHAAGVLGLFKGTPEVISGVKDLFAKRALTTESLDAAVQHTFGSIEPVQRSGAVSADVPSKAPYQPVAGDLSVQHEGNIAPPRQPHGDVTITPDEEPAPPEQTKPPYEPYAGDRTVTGTGTEPPPPIKQPLKASEPAAQTAEVLKKAGVQKALKDAGVAAPSATVRQIRPGIEVGPTLTPRMDLTFYGDKTGEGASLMQLTRYNINELRAMAVQRGLDVSPKETHLQLIEKIHDDLSPAEIKEFNDAAAERGRFSPQAKTKRGKLATAQAAADSPIPSPDRRTNLDLRQAIEQMSPEDQVKAIYQSDKTGLPNKRAFEWAENTRGPAKAIGMSDADGLKAMNDTHGYAAGDALLKAKADALKEAGLEVFHDKGDEFLFRGDSPEDIAAKLDKAKDILQNKVIEFKDSQGNVRHFSGAQFSYGTGSDLSTAEAALKANKSGRKASGAAAGRGEMGSIKEVKP